MERKPDISIVIVNYNVKDFLFQCLKSIEAGKSRFNVQTIVVDNNSEDGSMEYLIPLFPEVDFIPLKDNIGFGRANNLGFDKALGKYVLILNPDTIISNDTLEVMWDYMERDTKCGIAGCKVLNADGTFQLACRRGFPTPWASFSKLFGLQKLFPKSKTFAGYNQTFRSVDETYYIDAVIGAFMFARKEALDQAKGFDPTFFMYGEDIDLCFRVNQNGWSIAYVHTTSIVHYKGESTRRSSINEVKHFYEAMEIFVEKHYGKSHLFLAFLKTGIVLRSFVARASKFRRDFFYIISDSIIANFALITSTKIRFHELFAFPDYAYPTVFIAISVVVFLSLFAVGEYFEEKQSGRKAVFGLMISFFLLSSLTYFFPEYGFSRGVLLMSIGISIFLSVALRGIVGFTNKYAGKAKSKRVLIVGINPESKEIISNIQSSPTVNIILVGIVSIESSSISEIEGVPVVGTFSYLSKLINDLRVDEVIMTDKSIQSDKLINILISNADARVRFHSVIEYDELLAAKIIDDIAGIEPTVTKYNLSIFRNRIVKRCLDISISGLLLSIGLPFIPIFSKSVKATLQKLTKVLFGKMSIIGLYPTENMRADLSKIGILGLAHISNPSSLTPEAIKKLNDYYIKHYSLLLDLDILIKYIFRK